MAVAAQLQLAKGIVKAVFRTPPTRAAEVVVPASGPVKVTTIPKDEANVEVDQPAPASH